MSLEEESVPRPPAADLAPLPPAPEVSAAQARATRPGRTAATAVPWLAGLLVLLIAAVLSAPFWAPPVAAVLPWGSAATSAEAALSGRLDAAEQRLAAAEKAIADAKAAQTALFGRLDRVDTALGEAQQAAAATQQRLEQRIAAAEAKAGATPAVDPADLARLQQQVAQLGGSNTELGRRLAALEQSTASGAGSQRSEAALALTVSQIREAVQQARPFSAEYDSLLALSRDQPDIMAAAAPLTDAAKAGVPGDLALAKRLSELAGAIATAAPPPAEEDWGARALAELRSLVTIRRVDGIGRSGPGATVAAAQLALSRGDLAAAVAEIEKLEGPNAAAARPWLQMARARLQVETALDQVQALLIKRLGPAPLGVIPDPVPPGTSAPAPPASRS